DRADLGRDVHGVGGESLLGELERDSGPGRRLEEEIDDRLAAKRGDLLDRPLAHFLERLRGVEDEPDLIRRERLEIDEILAEGCGHGCRTKLTASSPSRSATSTSTRSVGVVVSV